jgi:hypothetical protein
MVRWLLPLVLVAACDSFPTPAQLDHATVLAVIADPPIVAPGATSHLVVVAADHDGPITPPVTWAMASTYPLVPPMGAVAANSDGSATYTAPDPVPTLPSGTPPVDTIQASVMSEPPVDALKAVGVAAGIASADPKITDVTLDGTSVLTGGAIAVKAMGQLSVATDPAPDDHWTFAWYATAGKIDHYQSNPTTIVGADTAGPGWLFVVVRDGAGGAAVAQIQLTVQ